MKKKIKHKNQRVQKKRKQKHKQLVNVISNSVFFLCVSLCVLFLFKVKTHAVEGFSMFPTLENGDRIFVNKGEAPKRYSIITLDPLKKKKESYVKRVIGLPGDSIWLEGTSFF